LRPTVPGAIIFQFLVRVLRYYAPEDVRLEEMPVPEPGPGELLLRVRNCATCGTDVKIYFHGHRNLKPPRVIGHEIAGEVEALGDGVDEFAVGDGVQVIAAVPCGECRECLLGHENICESLTAIGYDYDGGYAEYLIVPELVLRVGGVNRIPEGLAFEEAAMTEPLACVLNGEELARVGEGDDVVIIGAGPIGCMHARLARSRGASRITLVERSAERLELAAARVHPDEVVPAAGDSDAVAAVHALSDGRGADVVLVTAPTRAAQEESLRMAANRGRISLFGSLPKDDSQITIDANDIHYRELTVVGAANSTPAQNAAALEMIADGRVPVADLITETLPLEGFHDAIMAVRSGRGMKYVLAPWAPRAQRV
jgi:L-iditol 2-dehydrogenase